MKTTIRNKLFTFFILVLSLCMLFGVSSIVKTTGYASTTTIATQVAGASVRVNDQATSGIKFKARLSKSKYDALYMNNGGAEGNLKAGMIIVPTDYIEKAGGYTFTAFKNANLTVGSKTIDEFKLSDDGNYLEFTMSLIGLKDVNYTRDFESIVYIESATAIEGFEEFDGKYYAYATRNADNARNIYEVASKAYNDVGSPEYEALGETGLAIAKSYMDGVVDIKFNETTGKFEIANNTEHYTSPYTLTTDANGNTTISGGTIKSMMYNGESKNAFNVEETTGAKLHAVKMEGATVDENGVITTTGRGIGNSGQLFGLIPTAKAANNINENGWSTSYYAFDGKYGVGTAIDIYFTGNNMPEIMFFADEINDNLTGYSAYTHASPYYATASGEKGVLITNGFYNSTNSAQNNFNIWGPNRLFVGESKALDGTLSGFLGSKTYALEYGSNTGTMKHFVQSYIAENYADVNFKYTVSTYKSADNKLGIKGVLVNVDTQATIHSYDYKLDILSQIEPGAIVLYDTVKGEDTIFSCSAPYGVEENVVLSSGATVAPNGTVTFKGSSIHGNSQTFALITSKLDYTNYEPIHYLGLEGEYGVGTYLDFYFTGNNMPEVMFFADVIDDQLTSYATYISTTVDTTTTYTTTSNGRKGVLVSNGIYGTREDLDIAHAFTVWGPNRIHIGDNVRLAGGIIYNLSSAKISITDGSLLTQETLAKEDYANTEFKYTLGTYAVEDELGIHATLYTITDGVETVAVELKQSTGIALSEITAGNIIIYDTLKNSDTVFKYSKPYESGPELSKGATIAEDGTITTNSTATGNRMYDLANVKNNYYVPSGLYSVGTYVDVTFTGNNMPEVMMFSDVVSGNMTAYATYTYVSGSGDYTQYTLSGNKGLLFSNGFAGGVDNNGAPDKYAIWGMDKIYSTSGLGDGYRSAMSGAIKVYDKTTAVAQALSQLSLAATYAETALKYTVGTYADGEYLAVEVILVDVETNQELAHINLTTDILVADVEPGRIVFYDSVKGTGTTTVFKIDKVYQKAN